MELPVRYSRLTPAERRKVRQLYVQQQGGLCWYCLSPLEGPPEKEIADLEVTERLFPKSFFKWPVHLHHDHVTDKTIGAVHCHCNAVLWEYEGE